MPLDALIVGAGPAGSVAALRLARAGASVRIVDRARFPRDKLCGDTVNPGTLAILDALGVGADVRRVSRPVTGMLVSGPGGVSVACDYPCGLTGAALKRSAFDLILLEAAVAAGARFDEEVTAEEPIVDPSGRVTGARCATRLGSHDLNARCVIAADGRRSRLAARLGLARWAAPKRWAFGAWFTGVDDMTRRGEMHIRADRYIGLAPLPDGLVNVCVVRELGPQPGAAIPLDRVIAHAVNSDTLLRERFASATQVTEVAVLGPLAVDAKVAGRSGLLLAGDAAGFIDPMTGDGLRFAVRGGELAARAALDEFASGIPAHQALGTARRREFAGKWRFNRTLRWLTGSPPAVGMAARLAGRWRAPIPPLIHWAGDCGIAGPTAAG